MREHSRKMKAAALKRWGVFFCQVPRAGIAERGEEVAKNASMYLSWSVYLSKNRCIRVYFLSYMCDMCVYVYVVWYQKGVHHFRHLQTGRQELNDKRAAEEERKQLEMEARQKLEKQLAKEELLGSFLEVTGDQNPQYIYVCTYIYIYIYTIKRSQNHW